MYTSMVDYCFVDGKLKLLAIRRKAHPYQHRLALAGGFQNKDEDATHACIRESQRRSWARSASE